MLIEQFNHTIDAWINELGHYELENLLTVPAPGSWSLGQVYMHLVEEMNFHLEQIRTCLANNDHSAEEKSVEAKKMFLDNAFPDTVIEGPPSNNRVPQPGSKEQLLQGLRGIKAEVNIIGSLIPGSPNTGKTRHPGLGYFNASEWLQFSEMHLRHHLRQKARIDQILKSRIKTVANTSNPDRPGGNVPSGSDE